MNHIVIDNSISDRIGREIFDMIMREQIWHLNLGSDESTNNEPKQPGSLLFDQYQSTENNRFIEGYLISTFTNIMENNQLTFNRLYRILCTATYPLCHLEKHTDHESHNFETMVLYVTPEDYSDDKCGTIIDNVYVDYKFCRSVIFKSNVPHTGCAPTKVKKFPRLSIGFCYEV